MLKWWRLIILIIFGTWCILSCELTREFDVINEKIMDGETKFQLLVDSQAVVTAVQVTGTEENYTFSIQLKSPDIGCNQYADWWEVFTPDTLLVYRRVLTHSHVSEQPFSRSGGPVKVLAKTKIIIRGHMNNLGYGSLVFSGNVENGFVKDTIDPNFANSLSSLEPLPSNCAF